MQIVKGGRRGGIDSAAFTKRKVVRNITDFLNTDYRRFSNYVICTRAIPSIYDGFKIGARKILYSAFTGGLKDGSEKKLLNLVGDVFNKTLYAHGDASLVGTIVTMSAAFLDNLNTLSIVGQGGTLRDPKAVASPRYLFCKLGPYNKLYKIDEDLLDYVFDEGEYLEPTHFLPIIPTVLTARSEGMAPGYRFSVFSYNPVDIIDACIDVIRNGKIKTTIRPYVRGIDPDKFVYDNELKKWFNPGTYIIDEKNDILRITDLPYDVCFDKFEKKLNTLVEQEYIKDWKNFSHDGQLDYRIQFPKQKLTREFQADRKDKTLKKFMLQSVVPDDLLYVLDEHNRVKHFHNKEELLIYFVNLRQEIYNLRKSKLVSVMTQKLADNSNLIKFIELIISGDIKIQNRKKADIKPDLKKHDLPESLLSIPISRLTADEIEELRKKNIEINEELEYIKNTTIQDMYLDDLKKLKKDIEKDFIKKKTGLF